MRPLLNGGTLGGRGAMLPIKADGRLDYAKMSLDQIRLDLVETVSDLVFNAGQEDLSALVDVLERDDLESSTRSGERASSTLVRTMIAISEMANDPRFHVQSKPLLGQAADLLVQSLMDAPSTP
jgi:hypothetical protein